jgi:hypothetical protein
MPKDSIPFMGAFELHAVTEVDVGLLINNSIQSEE